MNFVIKECWNIHNDRTKKWTNKDKINALKLIKDTECARFEILMNGPLNLRADQMQQQLTELVEMNQREQRHSFFTIPSAQASNNDQS